MSLKVPLVLTSGQIQQLQAGDSLNASCNEVDVIEMTNANAGAIPICSPVYVSGASEVDLAQADAAATTEILGLAAEQLEISGSGNIQTDGVLAATTGQWDIVTGDVGGLTPGSVYYVDPDTAGMLTTTAPTEAGDYVIRVGVALNTTDLDITVTPPIKL